MIRDDDVTALLRAATGGIDLPPAPVEELVTAGRRRRRHRRVRVGAAAAAALAAVAVAVPLTVDRPGPAPTAEPPVRCVEKVPSAVLPEWARTGFTGSAPRAAYVRSHHGELLAVLFAQPLTAPPSTDHQNKILWVARPSDDPAPDGAAPDLRITARLADGSATARRVVPGGPGPSTVDLPSAGCWRLSVTWSGHTDTLDLAYLPG